MNYLSHIEFGGKTYTIDLSQPLSIGIALQAGEQNPSCYYAAPPAFETISAEGFIGSVAQGGSVNYQRVSLTPHGNGTHTECYGHISAAADATIARCLRQYVFVAQVLSLSPRVQANGDMLITLEALKRHAPAPPDALVIRTLPNESAKCTRQYTNTNPPYLEGAIGAWLAEVGVQHLLVDLPSVDREVDGGVLACHHGFWQYPHATRRHCTITEMIFVPDAVPDGWYLLHLQVPAWEIDAVPSLPVLYAMREA